MKLRTLALAVAVASGMALTGCTAMTQVKQQSSAAYHSAEQQSAPYLDQIQHPAPGRRGGPIISDVPYVSTVAITHSTAYPPIFDEAVTINSPPGEGIADLLHTVSSLSNVQITAGADVLTGFAQSAGSSVPKASGGKGDSTLDLPPSIIGGFSGGDSTVSSGIHYSGNLKGLLDQIAVNIDAKWTYNRLNNSVHFFRYETKVFTIATTPGDAKSSTSIGGSQQSVQGQSGQTLRVSDADTKTQFSGDLAVWKSMGDAIKSMLSPSGKVTLSEATGTIVVRDRFDRVDEIARYISQINAKLQVSIAVNVTVYQLHISNEDNRGVDWNILYNTMGRLANRVGATISTAQVPITGATSLVLNAPNVNEQGKPNLFAGSKFFLSALATLGHASVVTHATAITTNNQPNTVKVVNDQSYLAETTSLYTNGVGGSGTGVVGAGATLTPGSVETGFTMQVLPSVMPDGHHLLLQLTISDSTLDSLDTVSSGGNQIQVPNVTARQTIQRAWLKSGQTLVLAGFEDTQSNNTVKTPFGEHTWLFGGNRDVQKAHDALVIVITPVVTNAAADDASSSSAAL